MGYTVIKYGQRCCITCKKSNPLSEFCQFKYITKQGKKSSRYESRCRICSRARRLKRYAASKNKENKQARDWKERNAKRVKEYEVSYRNSDKGRAIKCEAQRRRKARLKCTKEHRKEISRIYIKAQEVSRDTGVKHHVDHIVPLCRGGLHIPSNLQILTATENILKGRKLHA